MDMVFSKGMNGEALTVEEVELFKTDLLLFCGREYAKRGWVMQLHYNCLRNPQQENVCEARPGHRLRRDQHCQLRRGRGRCAERAGGNGRAAPRTILYSLNPADNQLLDTIIGAVPGH